MKKQQRAIAAIVVVVGLPLAFFLVGQALPKRYTAEMRLLVDQSLQHAQIEENPYQSIDDISEFERPRSTQTQLDVLTGTDVLQRALAMGQKNLPDKIQLDTDPATTYENLQRRLTVENEQNSDILTVKVTENDPEVAAELANDIGLAYSEYIRQLAREGGADELRALSQEITTSKNSLTAMDQRIQEMKTKSHIFDVMQSGEAEAATQSATEQKLAQVQGEYRGAVAALDDAEGQLHLMSPMMPTGQRDAVNPTRLAIEQDLTAERVTLAEYRSHYYDDFPLVKAQEKRIQELEDQEKEADHEIKAEHYVAPNPVYQTQLENVQSLRSQVASLQHQVDSLTAAENHSTDVLNKIPQAEQELQALVRSRTVAEQDFEALEQRRSILQSIGVARQPSARIVSTALPPSRPSFPDPRLMVMAGLALGVFFAVLILMPRANPTGYAYDRGEPLPGEPGFDRLSGRSSASPVRAESDEEDGA
jgi:uncharacterized protein involved in exopolysaccharide biosynthesis